MKAIVSVSAGITALWCGRRYYNEHQFNTKPYPNPIFPTKWELGRLCQEYPDKCKYLDYCDVHFSYERDVNGHIAKKLCEVEKFSESYYDNFEIDQVIFRWNDDKLPILSKQNGMYECKTPLSLALGIGRDIQSSTKAKAIERMLERIDDKNINGGIKKKVMERISESDPDTLIIIAIKKPQLLIDIFEHYKQYQSLNKIKKLDDLYVSAINDPVRFHKDDHSLLRFFPMFIPKELEQHFPKTVALMNEGIKKELEEKN